jgi:hypothetical protein
MNVVMKIMVWFNVKTMLNLKTISDATFEMTLKSQRHPWDIERCPQNKDVGNLVKNFQYHKISMKFM